MNLVPLSPFLGRGNVGTPWRVRNKGAEFNPYIMASSCTLNTSRQRQSKRSCTELEASSQSDDDSPPVTDRWFVMQATDSEHSVSRLSPFLLEKAFKAATGDLKTVKRLEKGDYLLEAASATQSRCLLKLNSLAGCPVQVTPHRSLNQCKGVIRCKELLNCDKDEILSELKEQFVKDISNISVKSDSGGRRNTNTFIVTFGLQTIPKHLKIGFLRVPVSVYIPNPLRCFKCQRFGHGSKTCKGSIACSNCGQVGHDSSDCRGQAKCINCSGNHSASSKECPKWLLEKKVQQIKVERGISFADARKIATSENRAVPTPRGQPMAVVVRSGGGHQRPATRTIHTQTDLTWPRDLMTPTKISSTSASSLSTQTDPISESDTLVSASAQEQHSILQQSPKPGYSSEGQAPSKPPRGTRSSPGASNRKSGKAHAPKLNRPPKNSSVDVYNRYDALSDMEEDYYGGDQPIT